jgi:hypothetical protein
MLWLSRSSGLSSDIYSTLNIMLVCLKTLACRNRVKKIIRVIVVLRRTYLFLRSTSNIKIMITTGREVTINDDWWKRESMTQNIRLSWKSVCKFLFKVSLSFIVLRKQFKVEKANLVLQQLLPIIQWQIRSCVRYNVKCLLDTNI